MTDHNEIVRLAIDAYHGNVAKYTKEQSVDVLRQALVEANNGSTKIDYKAMRDGKCNETFAIVEEILRQTIVEGLTEDMFFMNMVDFRNIALGDRNEFIIEDSNLFEVADAAEGTQGIRRQRIGGSESKQIRTGLKVVKIYEELNRILAGQVDFNTLISKVSESFRRQLLDDIFAAWNTATADDFGGTTYFPAAGSYNEDELLDLISHVEAAAGGRPATILGTKKALRNLAPSIQGVESKGDLYNMGYYGSFYGTKTVAMPQRHKVGSTDFIFPDNTLQIIAGEERPIKCVYEGTSTIIMGAPTSNMDLTQDFYYAERMGIAVVTAGSFCGMCRYEIA